jgi:hypothetical protein
MPDADIFEVALFIALLALYSGCTALVLRAWLRNFDGRCLVSGPVTSWCAKLHSCSAPGLSFDWRCSAGHQSRAEYRGELVRAAR